LPAFYLRKSGLSVDETVKTAREVAEIARAHDELSLQNAILLTVPVPKEFEIEAEKIEKILSDALVLAEEQKVKGKEITPFLLSQLAERSAGKTLAANIALLENNAAIAAQVAVEIMKISNEN